MQLTLHLATSVEALSSHPLAAAVLSEGLGCVTTSFQNGGPKSGLAQVYKGTCLLFSAYRHPLLINREGVVARPTPDYRPR